MTLEQHTDALAQYMPDGVLFEAKSIQDSNFRQLLKGMAHEFLRAQGYIDTFESEYNPFNTTLFLSEWEQAISIADDCLPLATNNDERRRNILVKLTALGLQTADDFIALGELFGVTVTIKTGDEVASFPISFPIIFFETSSDARNTLVIDFPLPVSGFFIYDFPIVFGDSTQFVLQCLYNQSNQANNKILFRIN